MRGLNRATSVVILALALTGVTCGFPTDKSDQVIVILEAPSQVVLRGQEVSVLARAFRVVGTDTQTVTNVDFAFRTSDDSIARVEEDSLGHATVTGVNSGPVEILARAVAFEKAQVGSITLRVANPLEVDSVRPKIARHGEVITLYGVGVDSLFIASLAGVNLIEYPFSRVRDSAGTGRISFWVPPPARTDSLFYLGAGVFGFDTARTTVLFRDIFEPNDTSPDGPTNVNLDVQGPWPGTVLDPVIFTNPALAFEPVERATAGEDWFRFFTADTTQALTFFIQYPSLFGDTSGTRVFLIDSLYYLANGDPSLDPIEKFAGRDSADFIGSAFDECKGFTFSPPRAPRESTTIALKDLPSRALHVLTFFTRPQRYGLTVARGYFTADPQIRADNYEENDMCHYADLGNRRITLDATFADTLTIDNAHEIDWLRVDVPGTGLVSARVRTIPRPFSATAADTSDIDVYVLTTPNPATGVGLTLVALDTARGSTNDITTTLSAGASYYIAVVDFAGTPTRYWFCITRGLNVCPTPPAPVPPVKARATARPTDAKRSRVPIVEPAPVRDAPFLRRPVPRR